MYGLRMSSYIIKKIRSEDKLVAAAMSGILKKSAFDFYAPFGKDAMELLNRYRIGVLRNSAVKSDFRGRGIGAALLSERLQWLTSLNCEYSVGLTWLHGKTIQSDRLYKSAGFQQIGQIVPEFFKRLSEDTGMHCPYCGFPCLCSAAMYAKKN